MRATSVSDVTDESPDPHTPPDDEVGENPQPAPTGTAEIDLDAIERDLAGVERALARLSEGTYWTDEVTGEPISGDILDEDPTARRA